MIFSNVVFDLGNRKISSVRGKDDGNIGFIFAEQSRLVSADLILGETPTFTNSSTISYADDCFVLDKGKMHRRGELEYIKD